MLFIVSACSQTIGALQTPDQNQKEIQVEMSYPSNNSLPSPAGEQGEVLTFDPVVLFSLAEEDLAKPINEVPYYSFGNIEAVTEELIQSVNEGHSPWRASPIDTAKTLTQNLIPKGIPTNKVNVSVVRVENKNEANEQTVVDIKVPQLGTYTISLQYVGNRGVSFITEIVWQPESSESLNKLGDIMTAPIVIYDLREGDHLRGNVEEFPIYINGIVRYEMEQTIQNFNEGHPSVAPEIVAELYTRNLIPKNVSNETVQYELISESGEVTVKVPDLGTFEITLLGETVEVISNVTFYPW